RFAVTCIMTTLLLTTFEFAQETRPVSTTGKSDHGQSTAQQTSSVAAKTDESSDAKSSDSTKKADADQVSPGDGTNRVWPWQWSRMTGNWHGRRSRLEEKGLTFRGTLTFDTSRVGDDGDSRNYIGRGLINLRADFDLGTMLGWKDTTASVQYFSAIGRNGAETMSVLQGISNIDADDFHKIGEAWISHSFFDRRLRIKAGWMDANTEFAFTENGGEFINPAMGYSPTIASLPTYPDPSLGFDVFAYPAKYFSAGFGLYKSEYGGRFLIGETDARWHLFDGDLNGRLGVGLWRRQCEWTRLDGSLTKTTNGSFVVFDQTIWKEQRHSDDPQGLGLFVQVGNTNPDDAVMNRHLGAGLSWTGLLPHRDHDVLGVAMTRVTINRHAAADMGNNHEIIGEFFYKFGLTPWFSVKPDVQYISSPIPGIIGHRSVVATLRVGFDF
ncbi:MAG TPA: carbohydrate porin, partial [Blastocatellia bacterium]|nr:carbohydrate porin [Blastocatellia bacterium]